MRVKLLDSTTEEEIIQLRLDTIPRAGEKITYTFEDCGLDEDDEYPDGTEDGFEGMKAAQGRYRIESVEHDAVENFKENQYHLGTRHIALLFVTKLV